MAKIDLPKSRIEAVFKKRGCPATVRRINLVGVYIGRTFGNVCLL